MKILVDCNALYWWWTKRERLTPPASAALASPDSELFVSAATAWELATKHRIGKLPGAETFLPDFVELLEEADVTPLRVEVTDALEAGRLPGAHRDPFDRILIAQAKMHGLTVVSADRIFKDYGLDVIW
jgi:PIN domain nuclease of toxin-antitoxin system